MPAPSVIVDCDPGHDDAVALLIAARHTRLLGITTVSGNAPLELTTRNALAVGQVVGIDAPVHAGAAAPLVAEARHAEAVHGASGLDGPALPDIERSPAGEDAADFIVEVARAEPGLWLVPIGPLTNVATAIRRAPGLVGELAGISLMGGSAGAGNVTATAEFNVWVDPEAADVVFRSGARIMMSGLNLTDQVVVGDGTIERLRGAGTEVGTFFADLLDAYCDAVERLTGRREGALHDPCAVLAVTHPHLFEFRPRRVVVELDGTHTRGMTVVDARLDARPGAGASADVGYVADGAAILDLVVEAAGALEARAR